MRKSAENLVVSIVIILGCAILSGCSTRSKGSDEYIPTWWKPQLIYLLSSPHPRLYVEMDSVEGAEPSDAAVKKFRSFLEAHCDKPGGIEIVRGVVIPKSAARGLGPEALARKYMIGPPDTDASPPPAYICVLFYDGNLCDESTPRDRKPVRKPRTDVLPYPVICMNSRYGFKSFHDLALLHEAGHMLGLAFRTNYAAGGHCLGATCIMNQNIHYSRLLFGLQKRFCKTCLAELADDSKLPPPSNMRFVGPVLVRSGAGYHVLSLPFRVKLVVGELEDQDCRDFAAAVHGETPSTADNECRVAWLVKNDMWRDTATKLDLLAQIKTDPYDPVRFAASRAAWTQSGDERDFAEDLSSDVVKHCHESISAHPDDDWSYNVLAWFEATSLDASVRDGKKAVADATKACELSAWKNWDWIDTLAVASAESGDFKRAIEFQERALHTGNPTEPDRNAMLKRISIFKRSVRIRYNP